MKDKRTVGKRLDEIADVMSEKVELARDKMAAVKESAAGLSHNIAESVKKAVNDTSAAVSGLIDKKK